jgi:hypothetical protein
MKWLKIRILCVKRVKFKNKQDGEREKNTHRQARFVYIIAIVATRPDCGAVTQILPDLGKL